MQLVLLMVLSAAALATAVPALLPSDIDSRRFQIIRPPNDYFHQSFSQTVPAYSVRLVTFLFPDDRSIVFVNTAIDSGTGGYVRILSGGFGTNYVTVRAESAARALNYRVNVQTLPVQQGGDSDEEPSSSPSNIEDIGNDGF